MNNPKRLIAKQPKTFYLTIPPVLLGKYTFRACLANQIDRPLQPIDELNGITREANILLLNFDAEKTNLETIPRTGKECLLILQFLNSEGSVVNQLTIPLLVFANLIPTSL